MTGASLLTRLRQGRCLVMGTQIDYALEYLNLSGINIGVFAFTRVFLPIAFIIGFQSCIQVFVQWPQPGVLTFQWWCTERTAGQLLSVA